MPQSVSVSVSGEDESHQDGGEPALEQAAIDDLIARMYRDARNDPLLRARASEQELARLIAEAVHALWASSKVKGFIAVLAMRRVREELGIAETPRRYSSPSQGRSQ